MPLGRNLLSFGIGPIAAAALSLFSVPLVAWLFPAEAIGRVTVFQTVVSMALLFFTLGLDQVYVREFHEREKLAQGALLKQCFMPGFLLLCLCVGILTPFAERAAAMLYGKPERELFFLTAIAILLTFIGRFLSLILRMQERGAAFSLGQTAPRFAFLVTVGAFAWTQANATHTKLLVAHLVVVAVTVVIYSWATRHETISAAQSKLDIHNVYPLFAQGAPLIGAGLAYGGLTSAGTLALRATSNFEDLGIYAVAQSIAGFAVIIQAIFSTVWMPTVYKWAQSKEDLSQIKDVSNLLFFIVLAVFCFSGVAGSALDYLLPAHLWFVKYILPCSMAQPLLYTLSETTVAGLNIQRRTLTAFIVSGVALLVCILLCAILVPTFGAAGAASATAIASLVFFLCRTYASNKHLAVANIRIMYGWLTAAVILASSVALVGKPFAQFAPVAWLFFLFIAVLSNRKLLSACLAKMRRAFLR